MSDSVPAMSARGETASPAERVIRDAPPDEQPPPVNGRYVIVLDPSSFDGHAALLGEKKAMARSESTAFLWKNKRGREVVHPVSGCLVSGGQRDATWLPEGWTMNVFPTGWTLAHLEAWFRYAMNMAGPDTLNSNRGDIPQGSDSSPSYWPTPRGLVAHAYLIVRNLGLPGSPTEPRGPMDRAGCLAELRDLLQFFRGTLAPNVQGALPLPATAPSVALPPQSSKKHESAGIERSRTAKPKGKRGRKPDTDLDAENHIADAWKTRQYRTYEECGRALGKTKIQVARAIDNHRHRTKSRRRTPT